MQFLALEIEQPDIVAAQFTPDLLAAEARRAWELMQAGIIRQMYFDKAHNAVLLLEAPDADTARAALDSLPLVRAGLIRFEVRTLRPYDGFARLFRP